MPSLNNPEIIERFSNNGNMYEIHADGTIVQKLIFDFKENVKEKSFNLLKKINLTKSYNLVVSQVVGNSATTSLSKLGIRTNGTQVTIVSEMNWVTVFVIITGKVDNNV